MIKVKSNATEVINVLEKRFVALEANVRDRMVRSVAEGVLVLVKERIHDKGKKADGSQIGTYKNPYLEYRQKKHNRSADTTMIFSLTRNMRSQFVVIATDKGYGLGWLDALNPLKAEGLQFGNKTLKGFGAVYKLTKDERDAIQPIIDDFIKDNLKT